MAGFTDLRIENTRVGSSILSLGTSAPFAFVRRRSGEFKFLNRIRPIVMSCKRMQCEAEQVCTAGAGRPVNPEDGTLRQNWRLAPGFGHFNFGKDVILFEQRHKAVPRRIARVRTRRLIQYAAYGGHHVIHLDSAIGARP